MSFDINDLPEKYQKQARTQLHHRAIGSPMPDSEQHSVDGVKAEDEVEGEPEKEVPQRHSILVISHRYRLCDPDGIFAKHLIDCLTLSGVIPDDSADFISEVRYQQVQVFKSKGEKEKTVIELYPEF